MPLLVGLIGNCPHQKDVFLCCRDLGKYVCRPWNKPDGTINMSTVKHILLGIMSHLMTYPGSTFQSLCKKYSSVLNPVHVMELMNVISLLHLARDIL